MSGQHSRPKPTSQPNLQQSRVFQVVACVTRSLHFSMTEAGSCRGQVKNVEYQALPVQARGTERAGCRDTDAGADGRSRRSAEYGNGSRLCHFRFTGPRQASSLCHRTV